MGKQHVQVHASAKRQDLGRHRKEWLECPSHPIHCAEEEEAMLLVDPPPLPREKQLSGVCDIRLSGRASCEQGRAPSQAARQMGGICAPDQQRTMGLLSRLCQQ